MNRNFDEKTRRQGEIDVEEDIVEQDDVREDGYEEEETEIYRKFREMLDLMIQKNEKLKCVLRQHYKDDRTKYYLGINN